MHYRNGRVARNGDRVIQIENGRIISSGVLHDAQPGNETVNHTYAEHGILHGYDYCDGSIAPVHCTNACIVDCLHVDDVIALLAEKGLDKRPVGK